MGGSLKDRPGDRNLYTHWVPAKHVRNTEIAKLDGMHGHLHHGINDGILGYSRSLRHVINFEVRLWHLRSETPGNPRAEGKELLPALELFEENR